MSIHSCFLIFTVKSVIIKQKGALNHGGCVKRQMAWN